MTLYGVGLMADILNSTLTISAVTELLLQISFASVHAILKSAKWLYQLVIGAGEL